MRHTKSFFLVFTLLTCTAFWNLGCNSTRQDKFPDTSGEKNGVNTRDLNNNNVPETPLTPTALETVNTTDSLEQINTPDTLPEFSSTNTPVPSHEVDILPIERQLPPSEIQMQLSWFDGGASGGDINRCSFPDYSNTPSLKAVPLFLAPGEHDKTILYEGDNILICVWNLPPQSEAKWIVEAPDGAQFTGTTNTDELGNITISTQKGGILFPDSEELDEIGAGRGIENLSRVKGSYKVRIEMDSLIFENSFIILPATKPRIWVTGEVGPGKTVTVHYAGFEPQETITSIWYFQEILYEPRSYYLTSWEVNSDDSGAAIIDIIIPKEATFLCRAMLAAKSEGLEENSKIWWDLSGGWKLDLIASDMVEIGNISRCSTGSFDPYSTPTDNSSRFLDQQEMGVIQSNSISFATLDSLLTAQNWIYEAEKGVDFNVKVTDFDNSNFFTDIRITLIDPDGNLVIQDADFFRGCTCEFVYQPEKSGYYTIRVDATSDKIIAYSLEIDESPYVTVLDDSDESVSFNGPQDSWRYVNYGYSGNSHWTFAWDDDVSNWAVWTPHLPEPGNYEVLVFIPEQNSDTLQAKYHVFHNDTDVEVVINQTQYSNEWVSLGNFWFNNNGQEYIYLGDNTGEPLSSELSIVFDAVKFIFLP